MVVLHLSFQVGMSSVCLRWLLGMNTADVRDMSGGQGVFWSITGPVSLLIISLTCLIAFNGTIGGRIFRFGVWSKDKHDQSII
jgi:hypothetical protein